MKENIEVLRCGSSRCVCRVLVRFILVMLHTHGRFGECLLKIKEAHIVSGPLDGVTGELITSSSFVADSLVSQVQHNTSLEQPRQDRRLAVSRAEVRLILQVSSAAALQHDSLIGF